MSASMRYTVLGTALVMTVTVTGQGFAGCRESYYLSNVDCLPCPGNCSTCISDTNCTECTDNNYGPFCQYACEEECTDKCHKQYGYCTYGCVDGLFPVEGENHCSSCPSNCTVCKSSSECVSCHSGYHGNTCQYTCTRHCDECDQTTGNCLICADSFFNKEGRCHRCPGGCVDCYDNKNCTGCKEGYSKLHDGQCIMECPREYSGLKLALTGQDEPGVLNENIATSDCFDPGISQEYSFKTTTPCVRFMSCTVDHRCMSDDNNAGTCAVIMTYKCNHACQTLNDSYQCELNCSIEDGNTYSLSFCWTSSRTLTIHDVSTILDCIPASDDTAKVSDLQGIRTSVPLQVFYTVALCLMTLVIVVLTILLCRTRSKCADYTPSEEGLSKQQDHQKPVHDCSHNNSEFVSSTTSASSDDRTDSRV